tara:strand:+ start:27077 stop:28411 length:1335 start_codon:yes stop_codon:yes gene_type:complete
MKLIDDYSVALKMMTRSPNGEGNHEIPQSIKEGIKKIFGKYLSPQEVAIEITEAVRKQGDLAIKKYTSMIDQVELNSLVVDEKEMNDAVATLDKEVFDALVHAADRITEFHKSTIRKSWIDHESGLGEIMRPLERIGLYVPGGRASYPSTVLMGSIPAKVAGVKEVAICSPARKDGSIAPIILAAARIAGISEVYKIGGAQAIAALAYGTPSVQSVDKICGPGNIFVTCAKKAVFGQVDIDGFYGPTETVIIADATVDPAICAADLLAQAEHDVMASPILITTSHDYYSSVMNEVHNQIDRLSTKETTRIAFETNAVCFLVPDIETAITLSNLYAPEHLCLLLDSPWEYLELVTNAGGVFLGPFSPEVVGDYIAGPSHIMPTGATAKFNSYLGVHHFTKPIMVVGLPETTFRKIAKTASIIASEEGMDAHHRAITQRSTDEPSK